jgi:copper oxidase (laccase) domain-containing protein
MIPIGVALESSGGTALIADSLTGLTADFSPVVVLLVLMAVTMTLSDVMNNVATAVIAAPVAVQVADCAPVALLAPAGLVGVAHAGWRGLVSGVVEATIDAMRSAGGTELVAVLGPCIRPSAYEFGESALAQVEHRLGPTVRSTTDRGTPALDVPAAVEAALGQRGVPLVAVLGGCTAAEATRRWSHRARSDAERQAMVAWIDCSGEDGEP